MTEQPMAVRRVEDATGSHIEPELDPTWDEETKLRWHAAVVAHDTGLTVRVHSHTTGILTRYGVTIGEVNRGGQTSISSGSYTEAWYALNLIKLGARAVRDAIANEVAP